MDGVYWREQDESRMERRTYEKNYSFFIAKLARH
jgi:hypothetical protein